MFRNADTVLFCKREQSVKLCPLTSTDIHLLWKAVWSPSVLWIDVCFMDLFLCQVRGTMKLWAGGLGWTSAASPLPLYSLPLVSVTVNGLVVVCGLIMCGSLCSGLSVQRWWLRPAGLRRQNRNKSFLADSVPKDVEGWWSLNTMTALRPRVCGCDLSVSYSYPSSI